MKRVFTIAFAICLSLASAACSPAAPAVPEVTASPQPAGDNHPLSARTGVEEIDNVLEVLAGGDAGQLRSLVEFTQAVCTQAEGLGGPPKCREEEAEGTPVEVLPFIGPEGSFLRKDEIDNWQGIEAAGVYAVYQVSPAVTFEQYYPAGEYVIMLADRGGQVPVLLRLDGGRIVRVDYVLRPSPDALREILKNEAGTVILAPVNP